MRKKNDERYRVGSWGKIPNYECTLCHYSTLDEEKIKAHVDEFHPYPYEPPSSTVPPVYDRFGNPIKEE